MINNLTLNQLIQIFENNSWSKDIPIAIEILTADSEYKKWFSEADLTDFNQYSFNNINQYITIEIKI
jgi:hypothetical protein